MLIRTNINGFFGYQELRKSDLERYLEDPPLPPSPETSTCTWDILSWWRLTGAKRYPDLTRMVKDILGIQATSVASESEFSTGGRVVDDYRSSLAAKTVRILMLLKSWLDAFNKNKRWEKRKPQMRK